MINVFTDKEVTLSFGLDIEGNKNLPEARMVLAVDSGISLSIKAKIQEGTAKVTVPPLKHILKNTDSKLINAFLEVVADGSYFVPWKEQCELKESINVKVNEDVDIKQKTENISIKANSPVTEEEAPIEQPISLEEAKPVTSPLFQSSSVKEKLVESWNTFKKNKNKDSATVYTKGYFEGLDKLIKEFKPALATLTMEEANQKIKLLMKDTIALKESADAKFGDSYDKEYYSGYYTAILDTFLSM